MVDPQHPLEVQAQADRVVVRHQPLEAGVQVGGCQRGEGSREWSDFNPNITPSTANTLTSTELSKQQTSPAIKRITTPRLTSGLLLSIMLYANEGLWRWVSWRRSIRLSKLADRVREVGLILKSMAALPATDINNWAF